MAEGPAPKRRRPEDAFLEVVKAFSKITDFKNFARSSSGLGLEEAEIQTIIEDNLDVQEQKMQMLNKWKENNGQDAAATEIKDLVERFRKGGVPKNYISLQQGMYGAYKSHPLCKRKHVFLGEQKSEVTGTHSRAIKFLDYDDENLNEAKILAKLGQHENVVSTYHAGVYEVGPISKYIFIVMELCGTKNLFEYLEECRENDDSFDESERWSMIVQLFRALDFIHKKNVIHRDLKPHNILFAQDMKSLKLVDFGLSKVITHGSVTSLSKIVGTDGYIAPEMYNKNVITKKSDIFAAGITEAEILSNGRHPFGNDIDLRNYNIKTNKKPDFKHFLVFDKKTAKKLVKHTLNFEPDKRPTAEHVLKDIYSHQLLEEKRGREQEEVTAVKIFQEASGIIVFHVSDKNLYLYKPSTEKWTKMSQTVEPQDFSTVKLKKHIYTLKNKDVHRLKYQDQTADWKRKADMIEDHGTTPSTAVFKEKIYVCGKGNIYPTRSAEHYNSTPDQWTMIRNMNVARRRTAIVSTEDHVYCIGGWGETEQKMTSVERYDESTNEWKNVEPSIWPTFKASAVELNGSLYVSDDTGVQRYYIQSASWGELNLQSQWPLRPEYTTKLLAVDQKLYLIGYAKDMRSMKMYLLDPENGVITLVEDLTDRQILVFASVAV